jgi:hypothetical protein
MPFSGNSRYMIHEKQIKKLNVGAGADIGGTDIS